VGIKRIITRTVTAPAGASGTQDIEIGARGSRFRLKKVKVHFPSGSNYLLEIAFKIGATQIIPDDGVIVGDDVTHEFEKEIELDGGGKIIVVYTNKDTTNAHSCFIIIEGEVI